MTAAAFVGSETQGEAQASDAAVSVLPPLFVGETQVVAGVDLTRGSWVQLLSWRPSP